MVQEQRCDGGARQKDGCCCCSRLLSMHMAMRAGCPGDCPWPLVACPTTPAGAPCAGNGLCMSAWGTCQCWTGYGGADCSVCADGYIRRVAPPCNLMGLFQTSCFAPQSPTRVRAVSAYRDVKMKTVLAHAALCLDDVQSLLSMPCCLVTYLCAACALALVRRSCMCMQVLQRPVRALREGRSAAAGPDLKGRAGQRLGHRHRTHSHRPHHDGLHAVPAAARARRAAGGAAGWQAARRTVRARLAPACLAANPGSVDADRSLCPDRDLSCCLRRYSAW